MSETGYATIRRALRAVEQDMADATQEWGLAPAGNPHADNAIAHLMAAIGNLAAAVAELARRDSDRPPEDSK